MGKVLVLKGTNFASNRVDSIAFGGQVPCTGISLNVNTLTLEVIGGTETLTPTLTPSNTTNVVEWTTSNPGVATVLNGVVTAVAGGTATITATCGSYSATCSVTVEAATLSYVFVAGYTAAKSTGSATWCSIAPYPGSRTDSNLYLLAENNSDTSIHPMSYDETLDTSPYRFVPIKIPNGANSVKITASNNYTLKTRLQWFDSTQTDGYKHYGAKLLSGNTEANGWDQQDSDAWFNSQIVAIPDISGIDSFGGTVGVAEVEYARYTDHPELITIEFL